MKERWSYQLFADGYCCQLEAFSIKGGRWRPVRFPSKMALLKHPRHGTVLFDAGYSERFFAATKSLPYALYRWLTPVTLNQEMTAPVFLRKMGMNPDTLLQVVVSHFHADHMGALDDFPNARFCCSSRGFETVEGTSGFAALHHAFLPDLLPSGFRDRADFVEDRPEVALPDKWRPFEVGWDLLGDQSLLAIDLPGHAIGQIGLAFENDEGESIFLVADACWSRRAFRENLTPNLLGWIPQADCGAYRETLNKLNELHSRSPEINIIPTHCEDDASE